MLTRPHKSMTARAESRTGIHGADHALLRDIAREFADWVQTLPERTDGAGQHYPSAREPGWLPTGYDEHARVVGHLPQSDDGIVPQSDLYLLRRHGGGWVLAMHHIGSIPRTWLYDSSATLRCLYTAYRDEVAPIPSAGLPTFFTKPPRVPAPWLGRVLVDLYDPTIEAEAAARVIVALGGAVPFEPAAALRRP